MTPEAQQIAIAEACPNVFAIRRFSLGNKIQIIRASENDVEGPVETYDPLSDLNAMHEVEKMLTVEQQVSFIYHLRDIVFGKKITGIFGCDDIWQVFTATAAERAEALLKTLDLWKD